MKNKDKQKCKVAYCKCGIRVLLVATLPEAESDKKIIKDFQKLASNGHIVDYITVEQLKELFGGCFNKDCWKEKTETTLK